LSILAVSLLAVAHADDLLPLGRSRINPNGFPGRSITKKKTGNKRKRAKKITDWADKNAGPQEEVTDQREVSEQADRSGKMKIPKKR
jgi:hypothetical protein